jgi:molybdenum cofactor cytidylyltransferase
MCLVDHPAVKRSTYAALLTEYTETDAAIILPAYRSKRGHPVLFDESVFQELLTVPLEAGARAVVRADPKRVRMVAVDDPGVIMDVDTREDYRRLSRNDG